MLWELSVAEQRYLAVLEACVGVPASEVAGRYEQSRQSIHAWPCRDRDQPRRVSLTASAKPVSVHGQIPGLYEQISSAHHVAMNEFPDSGQQPTDDPRRQTRRSDTPPLREPAMPAQPAGPAEPQRKSAVAAAPAGVSESKRAAAAAAAESQTEPAPPNAPPPPAETPAQVRIAWDAAITSPVTNGLGQAEWDWFGSLVSPDPDSRTVPDGVRCRDFTLFAEDGFVVDCSALSQIAVAKTADAIIVLLVPARPDRFPLRPHKDIRPVRKPRPGFRPKLRFRR
jgi:hypothetical protein